MQPVTLAHSWLSLCIMKEAVEIRKTKAKEIKETQLYGELYREVSALACANIFIHKDGKTNTE